MTIPVARGANAEGTAVQTLAIAGMPRSGTTLLRLLCDGHPCMRITYEFGNFWFLGDPLPLYLLRATKRVIDINGRFPFIGASGTRAANYAGNVRLVTAHVLHLARSGPGRVTLPAIAAEARRQAPRALVVGDKMPQYIYSMDRLVGFEGLRFLVVYRDGRDVTSSFLEMVRTKWRRRPFVRKTRTAATIAAVWVRTMETMERYADRLQAIRYEDLIRNPERELQRVAEWLGVDAAGFDATMVVGSSVGKYRNGLTPAELADVLRVAGPTLERWGYPLDRGLASGTGSFDR